jgi:two-component system response regulator MtrA
MSAFALQNPDLVLLDVMLPGIDGVEVCKLIRTVSMVPIVMLTAKGDTQDVVSGLEAGADDYMVKPFNSSELLARLKVRLRRTSVETSTGLSIGNIKIDQIAHSIIRNGQNIPLTRLEFDLLVALAKEPGRVFSREALLSEVWGYRPATDTRLVNVHIQRLRSKVERDPENPEIILTVRGVGYKAGVLGSSE